MGRQIIAFKQQQKISPTAIQGLQVLVLPITALNEFIGSIMMENPVIDLDDGWKDVEVFSQEVTDDSYEVFYQSQKKKDLMDALAEGAWHDGNVPESETLQGFLRLQLIMCNLTKEKERLGEEIIENMNEDGYFEGDLREICYYHDFPVSVGKEVLKRIQTFYPKGVGATTLSECIVLQVEPTIPHYKKAIAMIKNDLEELADRKIMTLSRKYKMKKEDIQYVLEYIKTLNPRPGSEFYRKETVNYVIPDIVVYKENQGFSIGLNNQYHNLSINKQYLHMLKDEMINENQKDYVRKKVKEANIVMNSLEMRQSTLRKLAFYLLHVQKPFFEYGKSQLQPVMMKEAADFLGLHVSTISRAVQGKHIQTPWGVFPLKFFFSSTAGKGSTKLISPEQIKFKIQEIIEKENILHPLSDRNITEVLNQEGIKISRRTVAKYRQVLGIPGQMKRKRFSQSFV